MEDAYIVQGVFGSLVNAESMEKMMERVSKMRGIEDVGSEVVISD